MKLRIFEKYNWQLLLEMIETINPLYTDAIPPIQIGIYFGKIYSFDTRRLIIHQQAREVNPNVYIRYVKICDAALQERIVAIFSARPWNGIVTALRYGGKGSESKPYINPSLRPQLERDVSSNFKHYPNDRQNADANGFLIRKYRAKKIHSFLAIKAGEGSEFAKCVIEGFIQISQSKGIEDAYIFLIKIKEKLLNKESLKDILADPSNLHCDELDRLSTSAAFEESIDANSDDPFERAASMSSLSQDSELDRWSMASSWGENIEEES